MLKPLHEYTDRDVICGLCDNLRACDDFVWMIFTANRGKNEQIAARSRNLSRAIKEARSEAFALLALYK